MYGYSGKLLHIDLSEQNHWVEEKPEDWYKLYIGGVAMATRLCWENIEVGCDAYDPGNPVCFANGIFAGTPVPVGGKYGLASKSPLTGFIGDSLSGSWFCIALKRAKWDGVVIHNASEDWVHLFIDWEPTKPKRRSEKPLGMTRSVLRRLALLVKIWSDLEMSQMMGAKPAELGMVLSGAARNSKPYPFEEQAA